MIFHDLDALPGPYDHVYLSPHLDDAALSCGGAIARQRAAGQGVLVVTICTAAPPAGGPFSALARSFHAAWGLSPAEVVAARLREDEAAMAALGADALWAGELDAIYRHPAAYDARETLFGAPAPDDPLLPVLLELIGALRELMPRATLYAPLGAGHHVDHLLTCRAALAAAREPLALYEDFPYVARPGELEGRVAALGLALTPRVTPLDGAAAPKEAAIGAYASQMAELAESQLGRAASDGEALAVMLDAAVAYARQVGGERVWVRGEG
ncbi:MAG TPA: PIG-L family deacetylase [Chloroflexaceae bacterium]|nr:PIG-L family deacetylase [Chloroflexaceae bacterium]